MRILYIEDNESIARLTSRAIERIGATVVIARTAGEVRAHLETPWDLVLSDIYIPGGNGIDLVREMRQRYHEMPIVMLTGSVDNNEEERSRAAGATDFVLKPVSSRVLIPLIKTYLQGGPQPLDSEWGT